MIGAALPTYWWLRHEFFLVSINRSDNQNCLRFSTTVTFDCRKLIWREVMAIDHQTKEGSQSCWISKLSLILLKLAHTLFCEGLSNAMYGENVLLSVWNHWLRFIDRLTDITSSLSRSLSHYKFPNQFCFINRNAQQNTIRFLCLSAYMKIV